MNYSFFFCLIYDSKLRTQYLDCLFKTVLTSQRTVRPRKLFCHDAWMIDMSRLADIVEKICTRENENVTSHTRTLRCILIRNMKAAIAICSVTSIKRVTLFTFSRNEIAIYLIYICHGSWFTNSSGMLVSCKMLECSPYSQRLPNIKSTTF